MRFSRLHVLIIGLVVIVGLLIAFVMAYVRPQLKVLADTKTQVEDQKTIAETMLVKLKGLADAQADFEAKEAQVYAYMTRMPNLSTDRYEAMVGLWREYAGTAGPIMVGYIAHRPGIRQVTGFSLPPAPTTPLDPTIRIILVPVEDFSVRAASLPDTIQFLRDISAAPRMATISNVTIEGSSPNLAVTMPLTMYLVTRWALPGPGQAPAVAAPPAEGTERPPEPAEED
jgi:hypothetical protein